MEVKIGVRQAPRELVIETDATAEEITEQVNAALSSNETLVLTDDRGRKVIVPADALAYVETGSAQQHPVGFGLS
ncbi:DUF3107 domain-containing protein [Brevibacterium otitidis]|uniref:DUF3107 domain-containing protein n=1 Tax=Brevibacterium otitidis TaxID=53364 RepID=A0ABV5X455_9MICO|nr:DUF3107 domain-containing protein [Brevibacterium otitidis]